MVKESKTILELKKAVKTELFWIIIVVIISTFTIILFATVFGFIFYILYTYTDYRVIAETESLTEFPEEWTIQKGKIME